MKAFCSFILAAAVSAVISPVSSEAALPKLKKSVTWENICNHPAPLPVLGELVPVHSEIGMASWWSVGCETLDRDYSIFDNYKQYVGQTGVGYARVQSGWAKCEPEKGKYNFEWLDNIIDGLIEQGVKPWVCLCYGNPAYSDDGLNLNAKIFPEGPVMDGWDRYVTAVVKRYKGKVTMYEVWNEPDGGSRGESYDDYAVLFQHTAKAIRKVDKQVKIAGLGVCSPEKEYIRKSLKKMKELGCLEMMDYLTYHAYWPIPEYIRPSVEELRADIKKYTDKEIGLLQGETGCPGQLEYGHAMHSIEWNEYSQVKWDLRQMANHFGMGVPYSVFTMVDLNYGWMIQSFGLVRMNLNHIPQYLRPKFYGVQHMTSVFTRELEPCEGIKVIHQSGRDIACVGVQKGGKKIGVMLWYCDERPSGSLERDLQNITLEGITFERPVYVDLVTGKVQDLAGCIARGGNARDVVKLSQLPLWDAPVLLINRNAINFK